MKFLFSMRWSDLSDLYTVYNLNCVNTLVLLELLIPVLVCQDDIVSELMRRLIHGEVNISNTKTKSLFCTLSCDHDMTCLARTVTNKMP